MLKELELIVNHLNETHAILARALDALTEEQAARTMVMPEWSVKDIGAHLAGAERGMLRMAQRMANGENPRLPKDYSNDEYNRRQVAKRKEQSLAQIRAELDASRAELLAFMESLTADKLALPGEHPVLGDTTVKDVLDVIATHEALHGGEIAERIRELEK
jgi:uncharacterized protein (TIGR03083 family)